jgi:hypothetical protein
MYLKQGKIYKESGSGNPILQNKKGEAYEVSFVAAYVWEKLNGSNSLQDIKQSISSLSDMDDARLDNFLNMIINELDRVELIRKSPHELPI